MNLDIIFHRCAHCRHKFPLTEIDKHQDSCPRALVSCDECGASVPFISFHSHLETHQAERHRGDMHRMKMGDQQKIMSASSPPPSPFIIQQRTQKSLTASAKKKQQSLPKGSQQFGPALTALSTPSVPLGSPVPIFSASSFQSHTVATKGRSDWCSSKMAQELLQKCEAQITPPPALQHPDAAAVKGNDAVAPFSHAPTVPPSSDVIGRNHVASSVEAPMVCQHCHKLVASLSSHRCSKTYHTNLHAPNPKYACVHCQELVDLRFLEFHLTKCVRRHLKTAHFPSPDRTPIYFDRSGLGGSPSPNRPVGDGQSSANSTSQSKESRSISSLQELLPGNAAVAQFALSEFQQYATALAGESGEEQVNADEMLTTESVGDINESLKTDQEKSGESDEKGLPQKDAAEGVIKPTEYNPSTGGKEKVHLSEGDKKLEETNAAQPAELQLPFHQLQHYRLCILCQGIIKKKDFFTHLDLCPANVKSCFYCQKGIPVHQYDEHLPACRYNFRECYICHTKVQVLDLPQHLTTCSSGGSGGSGGKVITMYHGTSSANARSILQSGFISSERGLLGEGVYLSRDVGKATRYGPVIVESKVDIGKVCAINRKGHPWQKNWHAHGYDSAWIPANCGMVSSGLEEHCVFDSRRIAVQRIVSAPSGGNGPEPASIPAESPTFEPIFPRWHRSEGENW